MSTAAYTNVGEIIGKFSKAERDQAVRLLLDTMIREHGDQGAAIWMPLSDGKRVGLCVLHGHGNVDAVRFDMSEDERANMEESMLTPGAVDDINEIIARVV